MYYLMIDSIMAKGKGKISQLFQEHRQAREHVFTVRRKEVTEYILTVQRTKPKQDGVGFDIVTYDHIHNQLYKGDNK